MEKGAFGKIRKALIEGAKQSHGGGSGIYTSEGVATAKEHFQAEKIRDPDGSAALIEWRAAEHEAREKLGDALWQAYLLAWDAEFGARLPALQVRLRAAGQEDVSVGEALQRNNEARRAFLDEVNEAAIAALRLSAKEAGAVRAATKEVNRRMLDFILLGEDE